MKRTLGTSLSKKVNQLEKDSNRLVTSPITSFGSWIRLYEPVELPPLFDMKFVDDNIDASDYFDIGTRVRLVYDEITVPFIPDYPPYVFAYATATNGPYISLDGQDLPLNTQLGELLYVEYSNDPQPETMPNFLTLFRSVRVRAGSDNSALVDGDNFLGYRVDGNKCFINYHFANYTLDTTEDFLTIRSPIETATQVEIDKAYACICINDGKLQQGVATFTNPAPSLNSDIKVELVSDTASGSEQWVPSTNNTGVSLSIPYFFTPNLEI